MPTGQSPIFWFISHRGIDNGVNQVEDMKKNPQYKSEPLNRVLFLYENAINKLTNKNGDYMFLVEGLEQGRVFNFGGIDRLGISQLNLFFDCLDGSTTIGFASKTEKIWENNGLITLVGCKPYINEEIKRQIIESETPPIGIQLRLIFSKDEELREINVNKKIDEQEKANLIYILAGYRAIQTQTKIRNKYGGRAPLLPNGHHFEGQRLTQEMLIDKIKVHVKWENINVVKGSIENEVQFLVG